MQEIGLTDYQSLVLEPARIQDETAILNVELIKKDGARLPLKLTLHEEAGAWRVAELELLNPRPGEEKLFTLTRATRSFSTELDRKLPADQRLRELTLDTLLRCNTAVQTNGYDLLYEEMAQLYQLRYPIRALKRALLPWKTHGVNVSGLKAGDLVFSPAPHFNSKGEIEVAGWAPHGARRITFRVTLYYEVPKWWPNSVEVGVVEPETQTSP